MTATYTFPNDLVVSDWFCKLDVALINVPIARQDGPPSVATADEFMLMCVGSDGSAQFKHHLTRNYVMLYPDGTLLIPKTDKYFLGGVF